MFLQSNQRQVARFLSVAALSVLAAGCSSTAIPTPAGAGNASSLASASGFAPDTATASEYQKTVMKLNPIAYFPFNTASEGSVGGKYSIQLDGLAKIAPRGAIKTDSSENRYLLLKNQAYAVTSLKGHIPGTATIVAWVKLRALPSASNTYFYVCGESQSGNDFDLQFENDNNLYFYTGGGENTMYKTNPGTLVGRWNMIAVTYKGGTNGFRDIYWNGKLVANTTGAVDASAKTSQFSVGESLVFTGRYFQGGIDAVAVWKRALDANDISKIYRAATPQAR
jgi:hypothetical protein